MIENLVQQFAFSLGKLGSGAYLVVSLVVLLETLIVVGQFIPGSLFLVLVGFLCYMDVFDLYGMMTSVLVARLVGELINYYLGRTQGRAMFHEDSRFLKPRYLDMAQTRFETSGAKMLVTAQFLGLLRPFVTMAAGVARYPLVRFTLAIVFGGLLWTSLHLLLGFFFGASWQKAFGYLKDFSLVLLVAVPVVIFSGWAIRHLLTLSGYLYRFLEQLSARIHGSQWYQKLRARNPRVFPFLERRLSLRASWGLGATFGFACALVIVSLSFLIIWDVHRGAFWYDFDHALVNLMAQLRTRGADAFFILITNLGAPAVLAVVVITAAILCAIARQFKSIFVIVGSVCLSMGFALALEWIFRRDRPDEALQAVYATGFSFPSSRAATVFALFGGIYYWLWKHPGVLRVRAVLAFLLLVMAFLVGFSRIYLGLHYPSDVVSGFCLGFASVVICGTIAANWEALGDVLIAADKKAMILVGVYALTTWLYTDRARLVIHPPVKAGIVSVNLPNGARSAVTADLFVARLQYFPLISHTLFGGRYVPVNIVSLGSPKKAITLLEKHGFRQVRSADFFTREIADPVFPAFLEGTPAAVTLEKKNDEGRCLVRFWRTSIPVERVTSGTAHEGSGNGEIWLGSVVDQERVVRFHVDNFRQLPDVDLSADNLATRLATLNPRAIEHLRPRGLYDWRNLFFTHGTALLLAP